MSSGGYAASSPMARRLKRSVSETAAPLPPAKFTPSMSVLKASPTSPGGGTLQPEAADFARGQHRLLGFADSPLEEAVTSEPVSEVQN